MSKKEAKICWLIGSFDYRSKILKSIRDSVDDADEFVFDESNSAEEIRNRILTVGLSLFDDNVKGKIIRLKDIPLFKNENKSIKIWSDTFKNIPENVLVIIDNVSKSKKKALYNYVNKIGKVFESCDKLYKKDIKGVLSDIIDDNGLKISKEDLDVFVKLISDKTDGDSIVYYDHICNNVKKLNLYIKNKTITREDLYNVIDRGYGFCRWSWFNLIDSHNYCQARLEIVQYVKESKDYLDLYKKIIIFSLWRYNSIREAFFSMKKYNNDKTKSKRAMAKHKKVDDRQLYNDYFLDLIFFGSKYNSALIDIYDLKTVMQICSLLNVLIYRTRKNISKEEVIYYLDILMLIMCRKKICKKFNMNEFI